MISRTIQIWFTALRKPSLQTYEQLYQSENANLGTALLWSIWVSLLSVILNITGKALLPYHPLNQVNMSPSNGGLSTEQVSRLMASMQWLANPWVWLVGGPISFLLMISATHMVAKTVGGEGELGRYGYVVAAINLPIGLFTIILTWVPIVGQSLGNLLLFGSYILLVIATKAAYKLSTGEAIIAVLAPFAISVIFFGGITLFNIMPVVMQ